MEYTLAELYVFRDEADAAGNTKLYQHYCGLIDHLENEREA